MEVRHAKHKNLFRQKNRSNLRVEEISSISIENYRVYHIVSKEETVGYLGVFSNGVFRLSLISDRVDKTDVLLFVKNYIQEELHLIPTPDPRLS